MAGITLNDFKNNISGVSRPNRFLVEMGGTILTSSLGTSAGGAAKFSYYAKKAQIPKVSVTGPEIKYRGTKITLSSEKKHDPLTISFINDGEWKIRTFFEDWIKTKIYNYDGNESKRGHAKDYLLGEELIVKHIGLGEDIIATYKFKDVVPLEISEIDLGYEQKDSQEEFTVTFNYSTWERI